MRLLVSGCSSGIGEHLFNYYKSKEEYCTYGLSRRSGDYKVDACDPREVFRAIKDCQPDIMINCVGQASMNPVLLTSTAQYERVVTNNMRSTFILCREAGRRMLQNKWGRIINIGSCAVSMEIEGEALYGASKAGVGVFSRILSREFAPHVCVNCIGLGPVETPLLKGVKKEKIDAIIQRQIIKRKTTFEDITPVIDFLISPAAGMITGQHIYINGAG